MTEEGLGLRSFKSVVWNFAGRAVEQCLAFIVGIILARILAPREYGLIAIAMTFNAILATFVDGGFVVALIRKKRPTEEDFHTVFWFNILISLSLYIILFFFAPLAERFFAMEGLAAVLRVMSLILMISGAASVQNVQMQKRLEFKSLMKISLMACFVSGTIGVSLALAGAGVWALVAQQLASASTLAGLIIFHNKWRPQRVFSRTSIKELWGFGSKLFASAILNNIFDNIHQIIIGRRFLPADLAYYTRANSYQRLVTHQLAMAVKSVTLPAMAEIQNDNERLKSAYRRVVCMTMLVLTPLLLGLAAAAEPIIELMITDKWLPCVPYLQILCIIGVLGPLSSINLNVLIVKGRSDIFLGLEIAKKITILAGIIIGIQWGVIGLVVATAFASIIGYFLNAYYSIRLVSYSLREQLIDIAPYLFISIVMAAAVRILGMILLHNCLLAVCLQIPLGAAIYLLGCKVCKLQAYGQLKELVQSLVQKKNETQRYS